MQTGPKKVTKAVIAAAGFGTRFLPQTKAMPKEMLPLIDKPIIQYVVEELVEAGIKDIIIVGSSNKRSIEDHFDFPSEDLVRNLEAGGEKKRPLLEQIQEIANLANFVYVRQKGPYGLATPIACAAHLIGDEPFIYTLADDFFVAEKGRTKQLIETYEKYGGSVFACKRVTEDSEYDRYGVAAGEQVDDCTLQMKTIIEKPGKEKAPSNLASVSGYLLVPELLSYIEHATSEFDGTGELMLQPIVQKMIDDDYKVYAREIEGGSYYDTGNKLVYLKTVVDFALKDSEIGPQLRCYLNKILGKS